MTNTTPTTTTPTTPIAIIFSTKLDINAKVRKMITTKELNQKFMAASRAALVGIKCVTTKDIAEADMTALGVMLQAGDFAE